MNRRGFLRTGGALVVSFGAAQLASDMGLAPSDAAAQRLNGAGST